MKNVYEVLRQKEQQLARLKQEVEALTLVAPILQEDTGALQGTVTDLPNNTGTVNNVPSIGATTVPAPVGWDAVSKRWP